VVNFEVIDRAAGDDHLLTLAWTTRVRAEPGDAAITVSSTCRAGAQSFKAINAARIGPGKRGKNVPMQVTLAGMPASPAWCEATFRWRVADLAPVELLTACWKGGDSSPVPGACPQ
jgi:hypothetical protein